MQCGDGKMKDTIEHNGIIRKIDGTQVQVLIVQSTACSACHARKACMASESSEKIVDAEAIEADMKIGDEVVVFGQRKLGMKAVLWAFVVPFLCVFATLYISGLLTHSEAISGTISLGILIPYYLVLSLFKDKIKQQFQFYARKR